MVTSGDFTATSGVEENYKDTSPHFENILIEFTRFIWAKYMWGPFPVGGTLPAAIPEKDIRIWPVFVKTEVKERGQLKHRLLINLSDNKKGIAYNEAIQSCEKRVEYIDIRDVVKMVVRRCTSALRRNAMASNLEEEINTFERM